MKVRLAGIVNESVTDGPGLRTTFFFQGCSHHCPGCHNPQTWDFKEGSEYELETIFGQIVDSPLIRGVTLSGGDPLYQPAAARHIAEEYQKRGKDVWVYTGFTWEELVTQGDQNIMSLLEKCNVLVDGPFIQSKADLSLPFRGSSNQRLIAVHESLKSGKIMEYKIHTA